jgi:hypothetical protein
MGDFFKGLVGLAVLGVVFGVWNIHDPNKSNLDNAVDNVKAMVAPTPEVAQPRLAAGTYGLGDLRRIRYASRDNEINFDQTYKGHRFDAVMPFDRASGKLLGNDYFISFGSDDVTCGDAQPGALSLIGGWSHGTLAHITGTMERTFLGTLHLENCRIVAVNSVPAQAPPAAVAQAPTANPIARPSEDELIPRSLTIPSATSASFQKGRADRQTWENWFAQTSGDYRSGAEWWASHRNLPNHGCHGLSGEVWTGCVNAKALILNPAVA